MIKKKEAGVMVEALIANEVARCEGVIDAAIRAAGGRRASVPAAGWSKDACDKLRTLYVECGWTVDVIDDPREGKFFVLH